MTEVKTNLRWAGGKSKMIKILDKFFPTEVNKYLETFTGGGSVLLHIMQRYNPQVAYANDPEVVVDECLEIKNKYTAETFADEFHNLNREKASHFFTANKTSFSGLNKNYSIQAYDRNFSIKCINKIKDVSNVVQNVNFVNSDFAKLDDVVKDIEGFFIYLDPPYYGNKDKGLYGEKGKLHKEFDHEELFKWVDEHSKNNKIMLSYDDSPYIRELYKDYNIYGFDFVYSMTNTGGNLCTKGKEIVITNYEIE